MLKEKVIVVGITGSIAAYKAAELVSQLKKRGAVVHCVMTEAAQAFVTPLTFRTLSQNPVITEMFAEPQHWEVEHVGLATAADLFVVAPATANILAKVSCGLADDFLTTAILATKAPVLFAPAMNVQMYENAVTQENITRLKERGYFFVEPGEGDLACGVQGKGRLAELELILARVEELLVQDKPLQGKKVLVTAGPTREPLDPVRFLSNRSSGKMGYALARQAQLMGAEVILISGPTALEPSPGVSFIPVETAEEMYQAVMAHAADCQIIIKAAAVGDYRPKERKTEKIKKQPGDLVLELTRNPDILAELGSRKKENEQILVGFAAETEKVLLSAAEKVQKKHLDFIVANDVLRAGAGFACDTNIVTLVFPDGRKKEFGKLSKDEVARAILQEILILRRMNRE
ncbi:MAG: bifunctional phosphopantothenoylcysteine decarboxylase/phosphopantothenate--cysteine ligase CoaBC [Peptococcia bacterium]